MSAVFLFETRKNKANMTLTVCKFDDFIWCKLYFTKCFLCKTQKKLRLF